MRRSTWAALRAIAILLGIVAAVIGAFRFFFVDVVTVAHNGMAPTVIQGDQVLLWRGAEISRNDIVVCRHPREAGRWVMGRVAAMPGGSVTFDRRSLHVDGHRVDRDIRGRVDFVHRPGTRAQRLVWGIEKFSDYQEHMVFENVEGEYRVPNGTSVRGIYLLGDNRAFAGEDSRTFGPVRPDSCHGEVFMRLTAAGGMPEGIPHGALDLL